MVLPPPAVKETPRENKMPKAYFIVRGGQFETMEGNARERNVVVEFRDRATAFACYQSPEYQAARAIRQKYADADFIIIEGVAD
jgi:uncharacterized protein (DUF1330 family)